MIRLNDLSHEFTAITAAPALRETAPALGAKLLAVLSRANRSIIASRQAQAERIVHRHMSRQDDQSLLDLGFTAEEIRQFRTPVA
jgi:hypothetical protein